MVKRYRAEMNRSLEDGHLMIMMYDCDKPQLQKAPAVLERGPEISILRFGQNCLPDRILL